MYSFTIQLCFCQLFGFFLPLVFGWHSQVLHLRFWSVTYFIEHLLCAKNLLILSVKSNFPQRSSTFLSQWLSNSHLSASRRQRVVPLDYLVLIASCFSQLLLWVCMKKKLFSNSPRQPERWGMVHNQTTELMSIAKMKGLTLSWGVWEHVLALLLGLSVTMPKD